MFAAELTNDIKFSPSSLHIEDSVPYSQCGTFLTKNGSLMSRIYFMSQLNSNSNAGHWVFTPYVIRNGKRIYPRKARFFRFWVAG